MDRCRESRAPLPRQQTSGTATAAGARRPIGEIAARCLVVQAATSTSRGHASGRPYCRRPQGIPVAGSLDAHLLGTSIVLRRGARRDLHRFHLLDVLGVESLVAAEGGLERYPVFGRKLAQHVVLARQKAGDFSRRNDRAIRTDFTRKWRDHLIGIEDPARFAN